MKQFFILSIIIALTYCKAESKVKEVCNNKTEVFTNCKSKCEKTCGNMNFNIKCENACDPPGCSCKTGLVRNKEGRCIRPKRCQKEEVVCPKNSIYMPYCYIGLPLCLEKCKCSPFLDLKNKKCYTFRDKECSEKDPNKRYRTNIQKNICRNGDISYKKENNLHDFVYNKAGSPVQNLKIKKYPLPYERHNK